MSSGLLSTKELALEIGVSRSTLHRWKALGLEPDGKEGRRTLYDLERVRAWMKRVGVDGAHGGDRRTVRLATSSSSSAAGDDQDAEGDDRLAGELSPEELDLLRVSHLRARIRKEEAMAAKHELDLAKRRGELVEKAEVEAAQVARVTYARAVLLGGPGILAGDLVGLDVVGIEERLEAWVRQALDHLRAKR